MGGGIRENRVDYKTQRNQAIASINCKECAIVDARAIKRLAQECVGLPKTNRIENGNRIVGIYSYINCIKVKTTGSARNRDHIGSIVCWKNKRIGDCAITQSILRRPVVIGSTRGV